MCYFSVILKDVGWSLTICDKLASIYNLYNPENNEFFDESVVNYQYTPIARHYIMSATRLIFDQ